MIKRQSAQASHLNRQMDTFIRMNPAEEDQIVTARFLKRIQREVDPVINRREVIQPRRAIGVADGNKISVAILLINRHDSGRRESVNGCEHRRLHQPRVGQRHEVVMAMDEVKLGSVLERLGDVQVFGDFGIDGGILFIAPSTTACRWARVTESPVANKVTSQPRATSPSVMLLATVSQAPYCRGGVRQATGDRTATLLLGIDILTTF